MPSFAEPVIVAALQNQEMFDLDVLQLLDTLFEKTVMKVENSFTIAISPLFTDYGIQTL